MSIKIETGEKKLTELASTMKSNKIHRKDRDNGEQERYKRCRESIS